MKNRVIKTLSIALSAILCFSVVGCGSTVDVDKETGEKVINAEQVYESTNPYLKSGNAGALTGETVYVLSDAEGNVDRIIESKKDSANGRYEKTEVSGKPPVEVSCEYYFNGNRVKPESIVGKDGKLVIRYNYTNNTKQTVVENGKEEEVLVPFTMMTALILDNEIYHNVEADNAKIVDDGSRQFVIGYAFPGLQESLELSEDVYDIPDYVEVRADVTNFKMTTGITLATNELFNEEDPAGEEKLKNLEKDLDDDLVKLTDAMEKLTNGAGQLNDGMKTLQEKSSELEDGVGKLCDGAGSLKKGADDLDNGVASLKKGTEDLASGLDTLAGNNEALVNGAKQVFDVFLASTNKALADAGITGVTLTQDNYNETLDALIASLDESNVYAQAKAKIEAEVDKKGDAIYTAYLMTKADDIYASYVTTVLTAQMAAQGVDFTNLPEEQQAMYIQGAIGQLTDTLKSQIIAGAAAKLTEEQKAAIKAGIVENELAGNEEVKAAVAKAGAGAQSLAQLKEQLNSYNAFYQGLIAYTNGVAAADQGAGKLKDGAAKLKDGSGKLASGAGELYGGTKTLSDAMPALREGIGQLTDGTGEMKEGLTRFDEEGVQKILDAKEDKLDHVSDRIDLLRKASAAYTKSLNLKQGEGIKYLYRMDGVEE